ncbi:hypothetical protein [Bradyrhizobium sp. SZCCHNR1093]|uniref:hypothetical protein n=1 Tax=Bradyrhizobium sp. SZCCHNR1093 TaxID=3057368 RepID=UPI0028E4ED1C|nr:hypothetical protein [Bradyrhizobium sp. SZCCHNR1093]
MQELPLNFSVEDFRVARSLADKLLATCQPAELWDNLDALSREQCHALDTIAFECATCNHWFAVIERREVEGRWECRECA